MSQAPRQLLDPQMIETAIATLQQRIDQLQMSLQQQQKLATLGMVTAVIAHEFNNILTPMISYTQYALSDKADDALRAKALSKALAGSERLANISKSLLGFARTDDSTAVNVHQAIQETLACLSRDLTKDGITLTLDIPADLTVAMNGGQLQQVFMNLIVNARAAMLGGKIDDVLATNRLRRVVGGGKRLTISAWLQRHGPSGETRVEIRLADTGPGIPHDVLPRIFEPFFSTKASTDSLDADSVHKGGTGLGLTICQELIHASGGTIRAEHNEPTGAVFIIELPIAPASS